MSLPNLHLRKGAVIQKVMSGRRVTVPLDEGTWVILTVKNGVIRIVKADIREAKSNDSSISTTSGESKKA
jgi:hypothetical protein